MTIKIAMMYDFDQTLCTRNMQEYSLLPELGVVPSDFWGEVAATAREKNMDPTLTYMYLMIRKAREQNYPIKRESFQKLGGDIEFYPGVESYFDRINEFGKKLDIDVQHFVISSGNREIIEGCKIFDKFTRVFASEFHYDENGNADWPALAINYTGKTQFLFRINKNALDVYDSRKVNQYINPAERDIPFTHMIYVGDGITDVPCMRLIKANGGYSIGVFFNGERETVDQLLKDDRINFAEEADWQAGSSLTRLIQTIITKIAIEHRLEIMAAK